MAPDRCEAGGISSTVPDVPTLTCPSCGHSGEIRGTEDYFEVRGRSPEGHWPVRKCRACGDGIIVKPRLFFIGGARALRIPDETWVRMQRMWAEQVEPYLSHGNEEHAQTSRSDQRAEALEAAADNPLYSAAQRIVVSYPDSRVALR